MKDQDILADIRSWRDEFSRFYGNDLSAMVAALNAMDLAAGHPVLTGVPRAPELSWLNSPIRNDSTRGATPVEPRVSIESETGPVRPGVQSLGAG
jgi:hypothetical protein